MRRGLVVEKLQRVSCTIGLHKWQYAKPLIGSPIERLAQQLLTTNHDLECIYCPATKTEHRYVGLDY